MTMPGTTEAGAGDPARIRLRPVRSADADLYLRLRCDPALMAELGGALPAERVLASLRREVEETEQGRARVVVVEVRDGATWHGAGSITLVPGSATTGRGERRRRPTSRTIVVDPEPGVIGWAGKRIPRRLRP
ncbi:hypothetical protein ACFU1Q_15635 [Brachybacterium paraconglomeratum]